MVSIIIAAHGRPAELRQTLQNLSRQTYRPLELIVVDDGSPEPLEPLVRTEWPDAFVIRHERSVGAHRSRNEGMRRASGAFILTLDDDSNPCGDDDIRRAVMRFEGEARLGVIAFVVLEGHPERRAAVRSNARYVNDFINCGQMMRAAVAREIGDYREFFEYYNEESDYALRVLDRGWNILTLPGLAVFHRQSLTGRNRGRIVGYRLRNSLWTIVLDYPLPRVLSAFVFKALGSTWEIVRLNEWRWGLWGFASCVRGLPVALRDRRPVSRDTMRRHDLLKYRWISEPSMLDSPQRVRLIERLRWYFTVWPQRRRFAPGPGSQREDSGSSIYLLDSRGNRSHADTD